MKLRFSWKLGACEQPYAAPGVRYGGVLGRWRDRYFYARNTFDEETRQDLLILHTVGLDGAPVSEERFPILRQAELAYLWRGYEVGEDVCVTVGREQYFSLSQKAFFSMTDTLLRRWCADTHADDLRFYSEAPFSMPPYELRHRGEQGYACFQDGRELWHRRVQGYLYTDMVRHKLNGEDAAVFGTDGAGGRFIALRLADGAPIFDIKTGGTDRWLFDGRRFYLQQLGRGGGLIAVSPTGDCALCPLPGVTVSQLPLALCGDTVLVLSLGRRGDRYLDVLLNAVDISES